MAVALNQLGQVSLSVDDVDAAEEFYGQKLRLRKLYRFGDLVFSTAAVYGFFWRSRGRSQSGSDHEPGCQPRA
jgi:catechol 2,3-dioxygenase-like lactoylglutathione lyase family enzyme